MADSELVSVSIAAASTVVATVGVTFQVLDYRRRAQADRTRTRERATPDPAHFAAPQLSHYPTAQDPRSTPATARQQDVVWGNVRAQEPPTVSITPTTPLPPVQPPRAQPVEPTYGTLPGTRSGSTARSPDTRSSPTTVRRAQILLLVLTGLLVPGAVGFSLGLVEYSSTTGEPYAPPLAVSVSMALIFSAPNVLILTVLSRFLSRGRRWAWVTTLIFLPLQSLFCDFMGIGGFGSLDNVSSASSVTSFVVMGISGLISGVLSLVAMAILLSSSARAYFRRVPI